MKAVQITLDEGLLEKIDRDPEAKEKGRSAFVRRALEAYLDRKQAAAIADAYRRGYAAHAPKQNEFETDPDHLAWPED